MHLRRVRSELHLIGVVGLTALLLGAPQVAGLAANHIYYFDDDCTAGEEAGTSQTWFGVYNPGSDMNTSVLGEVSFWLLRESVCLRIQTTAVLWNYGIIYADGV